MAVINGSNQKIATITRKSGRAFVAFERPLNLGERNSISAYLHCVQRGGVAEWLFSASRAILGACGFEKAGLLARR